MKLETFFEKFEQFADAPGAVGKMRELVLHLAVTGKLVPQDPNDKPADELLDTIAKQREKLLGSALLRKTKLCRQFTSDEVPHHIPETWAWTMLGEITDIGTGSTPSRTEASFWMDGTIPWITSGSTSRSPITQGDELVTPAAVKAHRLRIYPSGTILVALYGQGKTRGQVAALEIPATINQACSAICPLNGIPSMQGYLKLFLEKQYDEMRSLSAGGAQPNLNVQKIKKLFVALPPLAEQKRIVAKVDELMALCDRLEAQQQERETRHAALARASLARFADAPTPANLPFLFHASFTVSPSDLRKSILTLAVQGKLVPQDPNDEPAVNNVERNEELGAQAPFEIPAQWAWSQLSQLADINGGFAFKSTDYTDEGTRVVRISDFDEFGFRDHNVVRHPYNSDLQKFTVAEKNILMAMTGGTVGKSYFVRSLPEPMVVNQRVATIKVSANANPSYIDVTIRSEMTQEVIRKAKNSTNDNISMGDIKGFAIPIPPLAEQRRIVAKVDHLMAMVDQLEIQLTTARATAANLLDAIVAELTGTTRDPRSATRSSSSTPGTGRRGRPRKTA